MYKCGKTLLREVLTYVIIQWTWFYTKKWRADGQKYRKQTDWVTGRRPAAIMKTGLKMEWFEKQMCIWLN